MCLAHSRCPMLGAVIIRLSSSRGSHIRAGKARILRRSWAQQEGRRSLCARQAGGASHQEGGTELGRHCGILYPLLASVGRRAQSRALSCLPQETLKYNCCFQQLLRADPESRRTLASPWLLPPGKSDDCSVLCPHP